MELLAAVLIVRDEAKSIKRTIESLNSHCEHVVVLDTGSVDGTQEIARALGAHLFEEPFVDYAATRNRALVLAAERVPSVFTLTISADETLVGGEDLRAFLEAHRDASEGSYCVMMQSGPRMWPFPRVLRSGGGWKFVNTAGNLHEQPVGPEGEGVGPLIAGVHVVHAESDPLRKMARLRERDLPTLTAAVENEEKTNVERAESMFQLAETHFILGHNDPRDDNGERELGGRWLTHLFSAMALYTRYAEIAEAMAAKMKEAGSADGQFLFQKAMYARFMYLYVAETFGLFEPSEMVKRLQLIAALSPHLPEVHWSLAKNQMKVDPKRAISLAMKAAKVAKAVYERPVHGPVDTTLEWKANLLAADCARIIKDKRLQREFVKLALAAGATNEEVGDLAGSTA